MFDVKAFFAALFQLDKIKANVLALLVVISGAILFGPNWFLQKLELANLGKELTRVVGLIFLVSSGLLLVNALSWVQGRWKASASQKKRMLATLGAVKRLDWAEVLFLREFYLQGQNTIRAPLDQPVVIGLLSKNVIEQIGTFGERGPAGLVFSVRRTRTAEALLTKELLGLREDLSSYAQPEVAELMKERLGFMQDVDALAEMKAGIFRRYRSFQ